MSATYDHEDNARPGHSPQSIGKFHSHRDECVELSEVLMMDFALVDRIMCSHSLLTWVSGEEQVSKPGPCAKVVMFAQ